MNTQTQLAERNTGTVARKGGTQVQKGPAIVPAVDIYEDVHGITLWADLPGVSRDRLSVHVQDGNLLIDARSILGDRRVCPHGATNGGKLLYR